MTVIFALSAAKIRYLGTKEVFLRPYPLRIPSVDKRIHALFTEDNFIRCTRKTCFTNLYIDFDYCFRSSEIYIHMTENQLQRQMQDEFEEYI